MSRTSWLSYSYPICGNVWIWIGRVLIIWYSDCFWNGERTFMVNDVCLNTWPQLVGEVTVNQMTTAELTMLNTLPEPLQGCSFTIEGVGLTDNRPITKRYANAAKSSFSLYEAWLYKWCHLHIYWSLSTLFRKRVSSLLISDGAHCVLCARSL